MAVISITITESEEQIVSGIPRSISISTNIPATIFYTLDGTDPDVMSDIYVSPIITDSSVQTLILKVFATNGTDNSPIVMETYATLNLEGQRRPHSSVTQKATSSVKYPFGTGDSTNLSKYSNNAGITVSSPDNTNYVDGYDSDGNPSRYTDDKFNSENYSIRYSQDYNSNPISGIGTLPGPVKILIEEEPPQTSEMYSNTFDPRSMVVYQDFENQTLEDSPAINKQFFSLPNTDHDFDGRKLYSTAIEGGTQLSATFVRSSYNPRTNKITYYYRDQRTNKWIISTQSYNNNGPWTGNLAGVALSSKPGSKFVFEWIPGAWRRIF